MNATNIEQYPFRLLFGIPKGIRKRKLPQHCGGIVVFLREWQCYRCGFIFEGDNPPDECPSCHSSTTFWLNYTEAEKPRAVRNFLRKSFVMLEANASVQDAAKMMAD